MFTFRHTFPICVWFIIAPHIVWAVSRISENTETILFRYVTSADSCMKRFDLNQSKDYLDSALLFLKKVNNPTTLGFYYQVSGNFYYLKREEPEAYKNYYQAIEYYEKAKQYARLNPLYQNLACYYYQKQDTGMMEKIVSKINLNASEQDNLTDTLDRYGIMALYYRCLYLNDRNNTGYLDSIVFYENKFVAGFEADSSFRDKRGDGAFNYMLLALSILNSKKHNSDSIGYYLEKAKQFSNRQDTAMIVNLQWIEGEVAFDKKDYKKAEAIFKQTLTLLESWSENDNLSIYIDIYSRLSEIAEKDKDYLAALGYERKKTVWLNKIHDIEKYKTISELSEKYESEKKDKEIKQLQIDLFKEKISRLYLIISVLGLLTSFFIIRWLLSRKKATDSELLLAQTEKSEIELQARLKDEMLKKAELARYESLLEIHFKNLRISEMDDTLAGLEIERNNLNDRIQNYTEQLDRYEQKKFISATGDPYFRSIVKEVNDQILKRVTNLNKKPAYLEALQIVNDKFFLNLRDKFQGNLSVINVKYCISFAIGMDAPDIAGCFCVEPRSVYVIRLRLRSNLKLGKAIDFNQFLRQLND